MRNGDDEDKKRGRAWGITVFVTAIAFGPSLQGCGASIQSLYEGDVRFEHCMALDAEPGVKAVFRRACWTEWLTFYTYGQTRDRVSFARQRFKQLSPVSESARPRGPEALAPSER